MFCYPCQEINQDRCCPELTLPLSAVASLLLPDRTGFAVQDISMRPAKWLCFADVPASGELDQDYRDHHGAHVSDCYRQQGVHPPVELD